MVRLKKISIELLMKPEVLYNYFSADPSAVPVCVVAKGSLVVSGAKRCRLWHVSEDGTWLEDERPFYSGILEERKAGESVGNTMRTWR